MTKRTHYRPPQHVLDAYRNRKASGCICGSQPAKNPECVYPHLGFHRKGMKRGQLRMVVNSAQVAHVYSPGVLAAPVKVSDPRSGWRRAYDRVRTAVRNVVTRNYRGQAK